MSYGERKGARAVPGDYSMVDKIGFGFAAALGIAVATFFDMTQASEASAVFVVNKWLANFTTMLGLGSIPLYGVLLILMAVGAASILYFQPVTFRGAFAQGFGALAAIMTIAPSDLGQPLPSTDGMPTADFVDDRPPAGDGGAISDDDDFPFEPSDTTPQAEEIGFSTQEAAAAASLASIGEVRALPVNQPGVQANTAPIATLASVTTAAAAQTNSGYQLRLKITFPDGFPSDPKQMIRRGQLIGRIHNPENQSTYSLFRNGGAEMQIVDNAIYIATVIPAVNQSTTLFARVEASGYTIAEERFSARRGTNPVWTISLQSSNRPLFLQRLGQSYDW